MTSSSTAMADYQIYNEPETDNETETEILSISNDVMLSAKVTNLLQLIFVVILSAIVSVMGIIANIVNIIVFVKQGAYKESGSVNLLGLAISDLCVTLTMLYFSFCYSLVLIDPPDLPWEPFGFAFVSAGWPHLMFAQITRTITAYVAFERCICVVFPFKVKTWLTPKRSIVIIVFIYLCFGLSFSPAFIKQQLKNKFDPLVNRTRIILVLSSDWLYVVDVMWYINSVVFNVGSVAVVLICTLITASRVQLSKTWRNSAQTGNSHSSSDSKSADDENKKLSKPSSTNSQKQNNSNLVTTSSSKMQKEKKLITMILSISVIFLLCYIPDLSFLLMYSFNTDIRVLGKYHNLALVMYSLTFFMETFNSSINIVVYYKMSSKYKKVLRELLGFRNIE